jgi:hypothetical protein
MLVERRSTYKPLPLAALAASAPSGRAELPRDYVAVKAYFSSCFPDTPANRQFVAELVTRLGRQSHVVLLWTGIRVDDHSDFEEEVRSDNVHVVDHLMSAGDNLAVQTQIIAGARALFTTYGGFSYLGPFYGVTSYSFYSERNWNPAHLDVMARAVSELRHSGQSAGFVPFDVDDAQLLDSVLSPPAEEAAAR